MSTVPRHSGVRYLLDARNAGDPLLIDTNAFAAALAAGLLFAAGLDLDADLVIDAHAKSFDLAPLDAQALRSVAQLVAQLERDDA